MDNVQIMNDGRFPDQSNGDRGRDSTYASRGRASAFAFALLVLAVLLGLIGINDDVGQQWSDVAKVAAVAFFVGAMVSLAMGMIGNAYHQQ